MNQEPNAEKSAFEGIGDTRESIAHLQMFSARHLGRKRFSLKNDKFAGKAASADHVVRRTTCRSSRNWGFRPQHVFKADETGLFWKRMPFRTFLSKQDVKNFYVGEGLVFLHLSYMLNSMYDTFQYLFYRFISIVIYVLYKRSNFCPVV